MSVLQLKQQISSLNQRERREIYAYLVRLEHERPQWKRMAAQRVSAMKKGRGLTATELRRRISG